MAGKQDRMVEAEEAAEKHAAELAKVKDWNVREILHYILDLIDVPHYARVNHPTVAAVRQALDDTYGYKPPEPSLSAEDQAKLDELLAKKRAVDEARALAKAEVEHAGEED